MHRYLYLPLQILVILLGSLGIASAETEIVKCVSDGWTSGSGFTMKGQELRPGTVLVSFRTWNLTRWSVDHAVLVLHAARGESPGKAEIAPIPSAWGELEAPRFDMSKLKFVAADLQIEPQGWLAITVPKSLVEDMAANRAFGLAIRFRGGKEVVLHSREMSSFAPYLIVTGSRK